MAMEEKRPAPKLPENSEDNSDFSEFPVISISQQNLRSFYPAKSKT
jgi:hypothetical protein